MEANEQGFGPGAAAGALKAPPHRSANSNEAIAISLTRTGENGVKPIAQFHPKFTYPLFEEEQIFGYQGLKINLRYDAADMRPNVKMTYEKKYEVVGDTEPADVASVLTEFLPEVAFQSEKDFIAATKDISEDFKPPGELLQSLDNEEGPYEIWKGNLADPAVRKLVKRMEVMVLFYIEGGSTIVDDSEPEWSLERWTVYFLYQKKWATPEQDVSRYTFVGYSTVYRFHMLEAHTPPATPVEGRKEFELPKGEFSLATLPCRLRISQFLILPPFLHKGNGGRLYHTIFADLLAQEHCKEVTVEDPNEAFDDLRDHSDLKFIRTLPELDAIKINMDWKATDKQDRFDIVDPKAVEALKKRTKIANRQLRRLIEMHLMSQLPESVRPFLPTETKVSVPLRTTADKKVYRLWKQYVKARLYRHNLELLAQMDKSERIEKLDEVQGSVELEYLRLLSLSKSRDEAGTTASASSQNGASVKIEGVSKKRPLEAALKDEKESKRARLEDESSE
ncbi:uncharacterized protein MKZ38_006158 [Zalerion maritima]|uniref:Histone acetyltransferase type B catalytic subunit n=1 Tax=Zalerion maritima TaxID=339359 RepID=A0AAD5RJ80_9PEZI|nr:uncharacterized protein MKZ38_006158 [Zalerion maritima]